MIVLTGSQELYFLKLGLDSEQLDVKELAPETISYIDAEIEKLWRGLAGSWASMDFKQPGDKLHSRQKFFGAETVSLTKEESSDGDEMVDFLISVCSFLHRSHKESRFSLEI